MSDTPTPHSPDANVNAVIAKLVARSKQGIIDYHGQTTERTDLTTQEWLTHLQSELTDGAIYAQKLISFFEKFDAADKELAELRAFKVQVEGITEDAASFADSLPEIQHPQEDLSFDAVNAFCHPLEGSQDYEAIKGKCLDLASELDNEQMRGLAQRNELKARLDAATPKISTELPTEAGPYWWRIFPSTDWMLIEIVSFEGSSGDELFLYQFGQPTRKLSTLLRVGEWVRILPPQ